MDPTDVLLAVIGVAFCMLYFINRERLSWAAILGLTAFMLLAFDLLVPGPEPSKDWIGFLVLGVGVAVMAAVVKRPQVRFALITLAMLWLGSGFVMAPVAPLIKVILIAAEVLAAFLLDRWAQLG